jgi:hypothetical protein
MKYDSAKYLRLAGYRIYHSRFHDAFAIALSPDKPSANKFTAFVLLAFSHQGITPGNT